jgi:uncharacterized protein
MTEGRIEVHGEARVGTLPDEVELVFEVSGLEQSPAAALADVGRRSQELEALLDEFGVPRRKRVTMRATVHPESEYMESKLVHRGYRAQTTVSIRTREFDRLGSLMSSAIERTHCSIQGPNWLVDLLNEARFRVCRLAAEEARRRAEAYAEALGCRLGAVLEAAEPDVRARWGRAVGGLRALTALSEEEPAIEAGELALTASIDVSFALEPLRK